MKSAPVKIEHDMKYEGMYRLVWPDNIPSADMYNLTRANDILNNYELYRAGMKQSVKMQGNTRRRQTIGQALDCIP